MRFGSAETHPTGRFLRVRDGANSGDLIWEPSTARVLTFPDANGTLQVSPWDLPQVEFFEHFLTLNSNGLTYSTTGTGAANTIVAGAAMRAGILQHATGSTATGQAGVITAANAIRLGSLSARFRALVRFPTAPTSTESYVYRVGFLDSATAEPTDGVFFRYSDNIGLGNGLIQAVCRSNNAESVATFTHTPTGTDWYDLAISCSGSVAIFYLTPNIEYGQRLSQVGDSTATLSLALSTNVPTAAGRELGAGSSLVKLAGTTSRLAQMDFMYLHLA